jgi:hypothetical protein
MRDLLAGTHLRLGRGGPICPLIFTVVPLDALLKKLVQALL